MDFQNVNPLNVKLNRFSGNLLPMTSDDSLFPAAWRIYSAVIWLIETIQTTAVIAGILIVPRNKALQDATVGLVVTIEVFFLLKQMYMYRVLVTQLIQKLNEILCSEDNTLKIIVRSTLKPVEIPLKFYCIAGTGSILVWCCMSFTVIFEKNYFLYEDYRLPIVLSKQPFSMEMFLLGNCIATIASVYMFIKKVALDVYMINLVLLVTAQYRYIAVKLTTIFRENIPQDQHNKFVKEYSTVDSLAVLMKMKALCRHHNTVVQITLMLKKLLSLNMSLMYLTNVFLFCFLDIMLISAVLAKTPVEGIMIIMYISGGLVQLYILCSCLNQLLDASVGITDNAFHEKWYQFGPSLKDMLRMMIITNNLECKLSISERFSLSLPSFMTILNQSYSFALLFLKMK
ncbi:PREDICTED: putative odorant receptor 92a [Cyphomyrmex costatus]|uniref:putative odorant receptor 92a n=1 Tax=Cyphomyrmex costatus TaxID=456900 RepID=UPI0008523380|nr:PREDICTED: putative odorant receptor 92a [Cyphomyrmex costatus]